MKNSFKIDFIGIGVQRAGTTWIANCLKEHPQICLSSPKEVHFFGTPSYNYGLNWYSKHFLCQKEQIVGEYDAGYYSSFPTAKQIKKHFPDTKLIICLRNPIERAFSNYLSVASFEFKNKSFEEYLEKHPEITKRGFYYSYLSNYFKLFPRQNILILIYEEINRDPKAFIKKVYQFLNVNDQFIPPSLLKTKNPSKNYRAALAKKTMGKAIKKINSYKFGVIVANFFKKIGFKKIIELIDKIISSPIGKYPQIDPSTRKRLLKVYQQDIKKLEKLIGLNLNFWR